MDWQLVARYFTVKSTDYFYTYVFPFFCFFKVNLCHSFLKNCGSWPRGYNFFSCSSQLSMKVFLLINVKMPTIVGVSTFMSRKNSVLGLSVSENAEFLYSFILTSI